ncbi:helix-turn-helix transcriptional regulator [Flavobacterium sp. MAH-1]|uniref:Helix-turn-helix transcriptional regulator n=1 Tax=Flavobacterium agri TaxID=2743471 RepID=A0A7Y8XYV1_9FLAO|nr:LuxR C-terminal-related transcriptional regulator [Flavobacterium agri]NUY79451.1 helix-turn-helix transcriptional regulator [Flavobacterium agri]NYA69476.1 helix-turn-helix transcriptional regulator [Flavobacterium agri]
MQADETRSNLERLRAVWYADSENGAATSDQEDKLRFLAESLTSLGPFYYYVLDFESRFLSHVHHEIENLLGISPDSVRFEDILDAIHPDDIDFVVKTEIFATEFFLRNISTEKLTSYKSSFNFRLRVADGTYALFNHQSTTLVVGPNGRIAKALNIHTRIDHLSPANTYKFSFIGLKGEPSYLNLTVDAELEKLQGYSSREIEIIRDLAEGLDTKSIASKRHISIHTVNSHRRNILHKSGLNNTAQLVRMSMLQGLI